MQSISALQKLHLYISSNFQVRYILTSKLTQDCLENFFSQIRYLGKGNDHPTALQFIYRFRILLFSKNLTNIRFKNVEKGQIIEQVFSYSIGQLNEKGSIFGKGPSIKLGNIQMNSLYYLAGYVAFKCKKFSSCNYAIGSELDIHKSKFSTSQFSQWLSNINKGRLCYPSDHFWNQIKMLEDEFNQY